MIERSSMRLKKTAFIIVFILFIVVINSKAQTVYVTKGGKKYHAKNCNIAKTGKRGIELTEAKKQGYEACKACKANEIAPAPKADKPRDKTNTKK
jgi:hypothetical protein